MVKTYHDTDNTELQTPPVTEEPVIDNNTVEQIVWGLRSVDEDDQRSFQVTAQTSEDSHEEAVRMNDDTEDSSHIVKGGEPSENGRTEVDSMADEGQPDLAPRFLAKRYSTIGSEDPASIHQLMNIIDSFDFGASEDQAVLDPVEHSSSISDLCENYSLFGDSDLGSSVEHMRSFDDYFKQHWMFGDPNKMNHKKVVPPSEREVERSTGTRNSIQPLEKDDSILPILTEEELKYPEGGRRAWLVVFGGWCGMFASLGLTSTLGSFQTYYLENTLNQYTPSQVGWIFSTFTFLTFGCGLYVGPLFDYYGPRWIIFIGSLLLTIMMFSLPYCERKSSSTTGYQATNRLWRRIWAYSFRLWNYRWYRHVFPVHTMHFSTCPLFPTPPWLSIRYCLSGWSMRGYCLSPALAITHSQTRLHLDNSHHGDDHDCVPRDRQSPHQNPSPSFNQVSDTAPRFPHPVRTSIQHDGRRRFSFGTWDLHPAYICNILRS